MQLTRSRKLKGVSLPLPRGSTGQCLLIPLSLSSPDKLPPLGFFATGKQIIARETPLGLYKGLGAVIGGIVPKMGIRFASFEGA